MKQELIKEKKPRQPNNHQKVVTRFVTIQNNRTFWPHEMKIAGQLIKKYSIEFLLWCPKPNGYELTSLVWFLTDFGKNYLSDQLFEYSKEKTSPSILPETISLSSEKIGEDVVIPTTEPKSLKEFLNYGKEK